MKVLITGGAGYIGSTVASACLDSGITPVIIDNLSTGNIEFAREHIFYRGDIADEPLLAQIFRDHPDISAAVHCAALTAVDDSVRDPLSYYRENVAKTITFVQGLLAHGCDRLLFSSSAAIYASADQLAIDEYSPVDAISPYGRTKLIAEQLFQDVSAATELRVISLRYFNPIGADPQLRSGPRGGAGAHALGRMIDAHRRRAVFQITGVDYETRDGTGIRDYVHVWDLALGHVAALQRFDAVLPHGARHRYEAINLGSGSGTTVRELVSAFESAVGERLVVREVGRRTGDIPGAYASTDKAIQLLGWRPVLGVAEGVRTALIWAREATETPRLLAPLQQ